ncbi:MAG: single-stranded DNA-binding protein [Chloracidobacterium sp.]|nr:single-stranded DNA-binding protein [Chloracidobacterium sp.]
MRRPKSARTWRARPRSHDLVSRDLWGRQAELANERLAKGRQVYIEGRLRQEEYTDREGAKR